MSHAEIHRPLGDVATAMELAYRIASGKVHINEQTVSDEPHAPLGGVKASGTGSRFGGAAANIEAVTETRGSRSARTSPTIRSDPALRTLTRYRAPVP